MGYTLAEKLIMHNTGKAHVEPGDLVMVNPDYAVVHDIYTEQLEKKMELMGFNTVWDNNKTIIIHDHLNPACLDGDPRSLRAGFRLVERYGVKHFYTMGGIVHQLIPEKGFAKPGNLILVTDSHTPTYGAVGCFSTGIGYTEMAYVWGKGQLWLKVPEAIKVQIEGQLPPYVYAKDIILRILGDLKAAGGTYKSIEFCGSTVEELSIDSRLTMANMVVECGGKVGLFPVDKKTAKYCKVQYDDFAWLHIDEDATYAQVLQYNAADFEPVLSCPPYVDNVQPLSLTEGVALDQVFLGSCTNGRVEDMAIAAKIMEGKHVAKGLKFIVTPASNEVMIESMKKGYIQTLLEAGAIITPPYCSFCEGRTMGLLSDNEVVLGTNNRNFLGRYGSAKAEAYLGSPAVAAASAIMGRITHPSKV